jgi:hypothetical protein
MIGRSQEISVTLLLVACVFAIAAFMGVCVCEDASHAGDDQCNAPCSCHSVCVLTTSLDPAVNVKAQPLSFHDVPLKLPAVPASIFNPPRV